MKILIYHRRTVAPPTRPPYPFIALFQDNWDDFGWKCRFVATLHRTEDDEVDLGAVRISSAGDAFRAPSLPVILDKLPTRSASLGESIAYYRAVGKLPTRLRKSYLNTMRDIVAKPIRRDRISDENLWDKSFMREASSRHALKRGGIYIDAPVEEVEPPSFTYSMKLPGASSRHVVDIDFTPHNDLPNRTILWIGRNGTGKTKALAGLAAAAMPPQVFTAETRQRMPRSSISPELEISRIITISYNAFDEFPLPSEPARAPRTLGVSYKSRASYKYCGLRTEDGTINADEVGRMLTEALEPVAESDRTEVLQRVLSTLLNPEHSEALISSDDELRDDAVGALSAGQRLVVAIFSNIIGFIEEGSLLLIDEPETNLHPGLLSSVIVALNQTLKEFDSYAIVATHSPILLQQVPSRYVRKFIRHSTDVPEILPLTFESFGEDFGELSRRVLGMADPERDFTDVLTDLYNRHGSAEAVEDLFEFPLGVPALAHLYSLEASAESEEGGL